MSGTEVELAVVGDTEMLRGIAVAAFQNDFEEYGSFPPGIQSSEWHQNQIRSGHYYKILIDGQLAGGICLIPDGPSQMEIKYFFIDDRFQGKGIGSTVNAAIEGHYSEVKTWTLVTPYKAFRNHHFYEKLGYKKIAEIQPDPEREFKVFEYVKNS